jgi:hypothetical protein
MNLRFPNAKEFSDQLNDYQLFKEDPAPRGERIDNIRKDKFYESFCYVEAV